MPQLLDGVGGLRHGVAVRLSLSWILVVVPVDDLPFRVADFQQEGLHSCLCLSFGDVAHRAELPQRDLADDPVERDRGCLRAVWCWVVVVGLEVDDGALAFDELRGSLHCERGGMVRPSSGRDRSRCIHDGRASSKVSNDSRHRFLPVEREEVWDCFRGAVCRLGVCHLQHRARDVVQDPHAQDVCGGVMLTVELEEGRSHDEALVDDTGPATLPMVIAHTCVRPDTKKKYQM